MKTNRRGRTAIGGLLAMMCMWAMMTPPTAQATALDVKARGLKTFYVDNTAGQSQVVVFSESTLEDFTVLCNNVHGQWRFDPQDVEKTSGTFFINVVDLRTGITLRDHDLRGPEWLDAPRYPKITVQVNRAEDVKKLKGNTVSMTLVGTCSLHGVTHDVRIPCTLTYLDQSPMTMKVMKGDLIRIRANFAIQFSDYKVAGPVGANAIGLKVANHLPIKVTIFGSTEKPPAPLEVSRPGSINLPGGTASQPGAGQPSILQPPSEPPAGR